MKELLEFTLGNERPEGLSDHLRQRLLRVVSFAVRRLQSANGMSKGMRVTESVMDSRGNSSGVPTKSSARHRRTVLLPEPGAPERSSARSPCNSQSSNATEGVTDDSLGCLRKSGGFPGARRTRRTARKSRHVRSRRCASPPAPETARGTDCPDRHQEERSACGCRA